MTIATYTDLQTAMTNWLGNSLNSAIYPDFITIFEAEANRRLRVRQQVTSTTLVPAIGMVTLPTDFLEQTRITRLSTLPQDMEYVEPSFLQIIYPDTQQLIYPTAWTVPTAFFTIENGTLIVRPIDDASSIQVLYYAKIPALASNSTNWLLTAHPDVYLFGSLAEASGFDVNDTRMAMWAARRDDIFDKIIRLDKQSKSPSSRRIIGPTP